MRIRDIRGREVLDSRGKPTVEVDVFLKKGIRGRMIVPSGASTGTYEALELRDGDPDRFNGMGVLKAVQNVNEIIRLQLIGEDASDQKNIDAILIKMDGTENKSSLGANAILGVSVACAKAAAAMEGIPLYRYLGGDEGSGLPMPMINILSGGLHARGGIDFQDFLVIPVGAVSFRQAVEMVSRVRHNTHLELERCGYTPLGLADEGGYGPPLRSHEEAFEILCRAVENSGLQQADDVAFAIDVASNGFYRDGLYHLRTENRALDTEQMIGMFEGWSEKYPLISIEDGLAEEEWDGWKLLTERLGKQMQLIGDDLFVTNPERLQKGIACGAANSILLKMNQIGTLSETIKVFQMAKEAGYKTVVSARSGETEDTTIADLAVALGAGQIKIGSLATSERLAKYNRLLRVEEELEGERN